MTGSREPDISFLSKDTARRERKKNKEMEKKKRSNSQKNMEENGYESVLI